MIVLNSRSGLIADLIGRAYLQGLEEADRLERQKQLMALQVKSYIDKLKAQQQLEEETRKRQLETLLGSPVQVSTFEEQQVEAPVFDVSLTKPQSLTERLASNVSFTTTKPVLSPDKYSLGRIGTTTEYMGGLLSDLVNKNPYLRDVIAGTLYGVRLPLPQVVRGKTGIYEINPLTGETRTIESTPDVKFLKAIDLGDRVVPLLSINGVPTVPAEYLKGLSPEAKLKFKQWQKEYGLKVRRLNLDKQKFDWQRQFKEKQFDWQKQYQTNQLDIKRQQVEAQRQKGKSSITPKTVVQTARTELEELLKTHGVVDFTGNIDTSKLDALREANPEVYDRIKYLLSVIKQANDMIARESGVVKEDKPKTVQTPKQVKRFLSNWGIE